MLKIHSLLRLCLLFLSVLVPSCGSEDITPVPLEKFDLKAAANGST